MFPGPGGNIGTFNARILGLSRLGVAKDLDIEKPEWEYADDLKSDLGAQLKIFDDNADDRTGGERMEATKTRNAALELFQKNLSRYRHYLCSASDDLDQSPELRRSGFKVRKERAKGVPKTPPASGGGSPPAPK